MHEASQLLHLHHRISNADDAQAKHTILYCPDNSAVKRLLLSNEFPDLEVPPTMGPESYRMVHVLRGHDDYVRCCAYSHDGRFLASASDDSSVLIWNATGGNMQHAFRNCFPSWIYKVTFSSSGLIAAADGGTIRVWDVTTGRSLKDPIDSDLSEDDTSTLTVYDITFSDDGSMLAAAIDTKFIIWYLPTFSQRKQEAHFSIHSLRFSKDGKLLVLASSRVVTVWEVDSLQKLQDLGVPIGTSGFTCVALSSDARFVAAGTADEKVILWERASERPPLTLQGHRDFVQAVSFSADDLFLGSASSDGTIRIWKGPWDAEIRCSEKLLTGHSGAVYSLAFSPRQGHLASCSSDGTLRVWDYTSNTFPIGCDAETKIDEGTENRAQPHTGSITCITSSHDGKLIASASEDATICLWDGYTGSLQQTLTGHEDSVRSIMFSQDAYTLASASDDTTVRIWSTASDTKPRILKGHKDYVRHAVFSYDGSLVASASDDRTVRVWDITNADLDKPEDAEADQDHEEIKSSEMQSQQDTEAKAASVQVLKGHSDWVMCVAFSNDGQYLAAGDDSGQVLFWKHREHHAGGYEPMGQVMKYERAGGEEVNVGRGSRVCAVLLLDGHKLIGSFSDRGVLIWNLNTCEVLHAVRVEGRILSDLRVDPDLPDHIITEEGLVVFEELLSSSGPDISVDTTDRSPYKITYGKRNSPGSWITRKGENFIFVPKIYFPRRALVLKHTVVLGDYNGKILFFKFKQA